MNANGHAWKDVLLDGETLTVEFKSDLRPLPDRELVAAVVALANTEGGTLLLGVEDDGTVSGVHPNHQDPSGLAALVSNRTNPPIAVRVDVLDIGSKRILSIQVPKSRAIVSTSEGLLLRRRLLANGNANICARRITYALLFAPGCTKRKKISVNLTIRTCL